MAKPAKDTSGLNKLIDLPLDMGHDLQSAEGDGALNQPDKDLSKGRWISGSSNREGGHDMHPHPGDHGEAQKRGSPSEADYHGVPEEVLNPKPQLDGGD